MIGEPIVIIPYEHKGCLLQLWAITVSLLIKLSILGAGILIGYIIRYITEPVCLYSLTEIF
jgi:hypothetical protein